MSYYYKQIVLALYKQIILRRIIILNKFNYIRKKLLSKDDVLNIDNTDIPIAEIGERIGFVDVNYFKKSLNRTI